MILAGKGGRNRADFKFEQNCWICMNGLRIIELVPQRESGLSQTTMSCPDSEIGLRLSSLTGHGEKESPRIYTERRYIYSHPVCSLPCLFFPLLSPPRAPNTHKNALDSALVCPNLFLPFHRFLLSRRCRRDSDDA